MSNPHNLTQAHIDLMKHALGLTRESEEYRNYYAAEESDEMCNALVEAGFMVRNQKPIPGGLYYFHVTEEGRKAVYGTK